MKGELECEGVDSFLEKVGEVLQDRVLVLVFVDLIGLLVSCFGLGETENYSGVGWRKERDKIFQGVFVFGFVG